MELGDGLNGYPQIIHGGCAATLLDEMCGILIMLNMERKVQKITEDGRRAAALNYFTACLFMSRLNSNTQAERKQI